MFEKTNVFTFMVLLFVSTVKNESLVEQIANKLITLFEAPTNQTLSALYQKSNIKITLYNIQQSFSPEKIEARNDYNAPMIKYINTTLTYNFNIQLEILSDIREKNVKFNIENVIAVSKYKIFILNGLNDNSYAPVQPMISIENEVYLNKLKLYQRFEELFEGNSYIITALLQNFWEKNMIKILSRYPKSIAQYNFEYLCSHIENCRKTSVKNCEHYSIKTATISNIQYEQLYKLGRLYGNFTNVEMDIVYDINKESISEHFVISYIQVLLFNISFGDKVKGTSKGKCIAESLFKEMFQLIEWEEE